MKTRFDPKKQIGDLASADDVLTLKELCAYLKVSEKTVYNMRQEKRFPAPRRVYGNTVRWLLSDIKQWLEESPKEEEK